MVRPDVGARFQVASDATVDALRHGKATGAILNYEYEIVESRIENGVTYVRAMATA